MSNLFDILVSIVLIVLGVLLAYDSYQRWRTSKLYWYIFCAVLSALAALVAFTNWTGSVWLIILALLLRLFVTQK